MPKESPNKGKSTQINTEAFRERIRNYCENNKITIKEFAKKAGISESTVRKWLADQKDDHGNIKTYPPTASSLIKLKKAFNLSIDYWLGVSEFSTPENDYIGSVTGLSDTAINALKEIKRSDDNAIRNERQGACVLPVLNNMLSVNQGIQFEKMLNALLQYFNPDYTVPVYHTGKDIVRDSEKFGKVLCPEVVASSSEMDMVKGATIRHEDKKGKVKNTTFSTTYLQHFAKENDPYDNITIPVNKEFLQAIALKEVEQILATMYKNK